MHACCQAWLHRRRALMSRRSPSSHLVRLWGSWSDTAVGTVGHGSLAPLGLECMNCAAGVKAQETCPFDQLPVVLQVDVISRAQELQAVGVSRAWLGSMLQSGVSLKLDFSLLRSPAAQSFWRSQLSAPGVHCRLLLDDGEVSLSQLTASAPDMGWLFQASYPGKRGCRPCGTRIPCTHIPGPFRLSSCCMDANCNCRCAILVCAPALRVQICMPVMPWTAFSWLSQVCSLLPCHGHSRGRNNPGRCPARPHWAA
jgi:hypothetical protein